MIAKLNNLANQFSYFELLCWAGVIALPIGLILSFLLHAMGIKL